MFTKSQKRSIEAWGKGGDGESKLGERLELEVSTDSIVLHDRRVPSTRGNIDHLVISSGGVWVVDAKNYRGLVERRKVGLLGARETRLYVNSRNQTKLVDKMGWQVDAVANVLGSFGFSGTPIHPTLCFTGSEWKLWSKPIWIDGVCATWPSNLVQQVNAPGLLDDAAKRLIAHELGTRLPPAA